MKNGSHQPDVMSDTHLSVIWWHTHINTNVMSDNQHLIWRVTCLSALMWWVTHT